MVLDVIFFVLLGELYLEENGKLFHPASIDMVFFGFVGVALCCSKAKAGSSWWWFPRFCFYKSESQQSTLKMRSTLKSEKRREGNRNKNK